jgi:hypothetical protein
MRTYAIRDEHGNLFAFEVSSLLGRRIARRIVASVPGARVVRSNLRSDVFCEFQVAGEAFAIEEPFGDNSRFWIGPVGGQGGEAIQAARSQFEKARLGSVAVALGILLCVGLVAAPVVLYGYRFIAQDKCLDSGGAWVQGACRGAKNGG